MLKYAKYIVFFILLLFIGCYNRDNPLDPENDGVALDAPQLQGEIVHGAPMLEWNEIEGAVGYWIYVDGETNPNLFWDGDTTECRITGCSPNQTYEFKVAAAHSSGLIGYKSNAVNLRTQTVKYLQFDSYEIDDYWGGNNDDIPNPGEWCWIDITIKNVGTSSTSGITTILSASDPYVSVPSSYNEGHYYGSLSPGGEYEWNSSFKIEIDADCPIGHSTWLHLQIEDEYENAWSDSFQVTIQ